MGERQHKQAARDGSVKKASLVQGQARASKPTLALQQAVTGHARPGDVLYLQQTVGNRAVRSLIEGQQTAGQPPAGRQPVQRKVKVARKPAARRPAPRKPVPSRGLAAQAAAPAADTVEALPEDAGRLSQDQALRALPEQTAYPAPQASVNGRPAATRRKPRPQPGQSAGSQDRTVQQNPAAPASIQKAGIADKVMGVFTSRMLAQAATLIGQIPDETFGPLTSLAKAGLHGFIKRLAAIPPTKLVKMAKKVFSAVQSPHYVLGFLLGLLKGFVVDGLLGIFVLIYDLAKLAIKLPMWGHKLAKRLGAPLIMALVNDISNIGQWISTNAPALASGLLEQLGGKGGLSGAVAQIAGYLLTKAKGAASKIGSKMASGLVSVFSQSKAKIGRALGEVAGRLSGAVLFEIILAVVTSGGGSAITAAKTGLRAILGLLGKIGKGFMRVIAPLGKILGTALRALKGWILALARSGPMKGLSTKLAELFDKLSKFLKAAVGRLTGAGKGGAGKAGAASTGGQPRVRPEGLPAPDSLPKGAKTTTKDLPAPASLPRSGAVRAMWTRVQEARAFARNWIVTRGRGIDTVMEFYDHQHFVAYFRKLAGKAREIPVAFVNAEGKLVLDLTRVDIPIKWYQHARVRVPRGRQSAPRAGGTTQPPPRAGSTTQPPPRAGSTTQPPPRAGSTTQPPPQAGSTTRPPPQAGGTTQPPPQAGGTTRPPPGGAGGSPGGGGGGRRPRGRWMSPQDWARDVAREVVARHRASGVGAGARSGRHGTPLIRAGNELQRIARTGRYGQTTGLLPEVRAELRRLAERLIERGRSQNHPGTRRP